MILEFKLCTQFSILFKFPFETAHNRFEMTFLIWLSKFQKPFLISAQALYRSRYVFKKLWDAVISWKWNLIFLKQGSQHAGGEALKKREMINQNIGWEEEELLEKLEKMFLKINSKSTTNRDAWEGEDEDTEEVLEIGQPAQKQRKQTKAQLLPTTNRDQTAEPLGDRETAEHCKRNTFSFEHGSGPRKNDNNRKQRTEEELNQLRKFALQLHCKKKRRTRKSVANCHEKAEVKIEQMMAVHAELKVYSIYLLFFLKYRHFAAKISIYYIKQRFWIKALYYILVKIGFAWLFQKTDVQMESTLMVEELEQITIINKEMPAKHAEMKVLLICFKTQCKK